MDDSFSETAMIVTIMGIVAVPIYGTFVPLLLCVIALLGAHIVCNS